MDIDRTPRIIIAALKGGAGKTFLTIGLIGALRRKGIKVSPFKKGPDYIDAGWLGLAAGKECHNLDSYLFSQEMILHSFTRHSTGSDIAVIEGNRGLYDGMDYKGAYSTAEIAKTVKGPVILIIDVTKVTRTAAAMALGCKVLDPELEIHGIILNRVAGARHERILRRSIEDAAGIPVIGSVGKLPLKSFPQRHLGLLPLYEHPNAINFVNEATEVAEIGIDLDKIILSAKSSEPLKIPEFESPFKDMRDPVRGPVKIGYLKDSAFQFYYPENLEALAKSGAEMVKISALESEALPELDALYIGGGFPETHADRLSENKPFKSSIKRAVDAGLPVYAECGGLMFLSRNLHVDEKTYPMVGVLPIDTALDRKPQGHGYVKVNVKRENPFYAVGTQLTGHEFHYSFVKGLDTVKTVCAFHVERGHGIDGACDGISLGNVLATYVHIHAYGQPDWAKGMIRMANYYRDKKIIIGEAEKE